MAISLDEFVEALLIYELISADRLTKLLDDLPPTQSANEVAGLAQLLTDHKRLTRYQAAQIYQGKASELVLGEYVLLDRLGSGSMGVVYKARHRRMQRLVAVKVLAPALAQFERALKRFHREVRASAKLIHPNVVTAFDANEHDGKHFLVMEFVEGTDLSTWVKSNGPLMIDVAIDYILQVSRGLHYAHQQGVVHRDIKPSNFLLDQQGVVKLLDLGLARFDAALLQEDETASNPSVLTQSGFLLGTAGFMAPEQSINAKNADQRADIYSLGCSLYYLLTGKMLYEAPTAFDMALAHCDRPIPPLSEARFDVSEKLARVYEKMVAKSPDERYQSVSEVIKALEKCGDKSGDFMTDTRTGPAADLRRGRTKKKAAPSGGTKGTSIPRAAAEASPLTEVTTSWSQPNAPSRSIAPSKTSTEKSTRKRAEKPRAPGAPKSSSQPGTGIALAVGLGVFMILILGGVLVVWMGWR